MFWYFANSMRRKVTPALREARMRKKCLAVATVKNEHFFTVPQL
jgi:hypothetical protein